MAVSEVDRRQRKKTKIFDESGLTDADRRVVRSEQRTLQEGMIDGSIGWKEGREANNAIFEDRVAYSRELVIDVENTTLALTGFAKEVEATVQVSCQHGWIWCSGFIFAFFKTNSSRAMTTTMAHRSPSDNFFHCRFLALTP
jgi:hypothetical protein